MNRYELGKRVPDFELVERFAKVLSVPTAFFYAKADEEAQLLVAFHRLPKAKKLQAVEMVASLSDKPA